MIFDGMSPLAVIVLRLFVLVHHYVRLLKQMVLAALSVPELTFPGLMR